MQPLHHCYTLFIALCLTASSQSFAGYTVIDDDLYPTSRVEPSRTRTTRLGAEQHYTVPFSKGYSPLTAIGQATLDDLIPQMQDASVHIVGRPDATSVAGGKLATLARNRANTIRAYLMRQGVPGTNIVLEVDTSPNPQPNGVTYPSDIYITRPDRRIAAPAETITYMPARQPAPMPVRPLPNPASGPTDPKMTQYINQAVMSGQMDPAVAVKLLRAMETDANPAQANRPITYQVVTHTAAPAPNPTIQIATAPPPPQTWTLDKKLTLRDNVDAWSKLAGWNPSVWDASNFYQVTVTTTLDGNFPEILRQLADSTGLNICAKMREKYVRVTDSNISCK